MTNQRDPKKDPRPGDKFAWGGFEIEVTAMSKKKVVYEMWQGGREPFFAAPIMGECAAWKWRARAKDWEVIHVAD